MSAKFRKWLTHNWADLATVFLVLTTLGGSVFYVGAVSSKVEALESRQDRQGIEIKNIKDDDASYKKEIAHDLRDMSDKISHIDQWVKDHE